MASKFLKIFVIVGILFLISFLLAKNFNSIDFSDKIVFISIKGTIVSSSSNGIFNEQQATSTGVISYLNKAKNDNTIKAVILEINSPGGEALASREIVEAVKGMNKPVVAWIRDVGASGAYWVASASDSIIADELSVTGSIGVLGSYLQFEGLMNKYGITYERLVGGRYKDLGSSYKELSTEEREILQKKINTIHRIFSDDVSKNRKKDLSKFSNGEFFLGIEAKEIGLIDHLGGKEKAIEVSKELASIEKARTVVFKERKSFFSSIDKYFTKYSYFIGKGISDGFLVKNEEFVINT
ncbi:signal peptide peptidase SppA [Candidatus Woesearchaeota archaeon]|nr:signal peptide peptidase SppA [Candidatus Woesearchaeota archaeon]